MSSYWDPKSSFQAMTYGIEALSLGILNSLASFCINFLTLFARDPVISTTMPQSLPPKVRGDRDKGNESENGKTLRYLSAVSSCFPDDHYYHQLECSLCSRLRYHQRWCNFQGLQEKVRVLFARVCNRRKDRPFAHLRDC
jgi:hypothetical protein